MPNSKRHTTNIGGKLLEKIEDIIEQFKVFRDKRSREIDMLKGTKFTDQNVANTLLYLMRNSHMAASDYGRIVSEWDAPRHQDFEERTGWGFQNAGTEVLKRTTNPIARMELSAKLKEAIMREIAS
jgi:hypothetical protein